MRDLASAERYWTQKLGFEASIGGTHPWGTRNVFFRFRPEFLELLALHGGGSSKGNAASEGLRRRLAVGEGPLGFAVSTDDLPTDLAKVAAVGVEVGGPMEGSRERPDGLVVTWRSAYLGASPWTVPKTLGPFGLPLPFLHQNPPDYPGPEPPPSHPNGAIGIAAIWIAARDVARAAHVYMAGLGLVRARDEGKGVLVIGEARIVLLDRSNADARVHLELFGEGIFRLGIRVRDLAHLERELVRRGIPSVPYDDGVFRGCRIDMRLAHGTDLVFVA